MKPDEERSHVLFGLIKKTVLKIMVDRPEYYQQQEETYLIRYSLFTCRWFAIKIHRILLSDDDCFHDHPWSFVSVILKGGYIEHVPYCHPKLFGAGSILYRRAPSPHKLQVCQATTTLVISFKRIREWGFYTSRGWKIWHSYIRSGRRCE